VLESWQRADTGSNKTRTVNSNIRIIASKDTKKKNKNKKNRKKIEPQTIKSPRMRSLFIIPKKQTDDEPQAHRNDMRAAALADRPGTGGTEDTG
jgi:hypothetical protein